MKIKKKFVHILSIILLLSLVIPGIRVTKASADTYKETTYVYTNKDATVYQKKSTKSYEVLPLRKGYKLILLEKGEKWCQVRIMNNGVKGYIQTKYISYKYIKAKTSVDMDKTLDAVRSNVLKNCKDTKVWDDPSENYFMWAVPACFTKKQIVKELSGQFKAEYKLFDMEYFNVEFIGTSYEEFAMIGFEKYKNCEYYNFVCYRASRDYHCPTISCDIDGRWWIKPRNYDASKIFIDYGKDFIVADLYGWKFVYDPNMDDDFKYEITRLSDDEFQKFLNEHIEKNDLKIVNYLD